MFALLPLSIQRRLTSILPKATQKLAASNEEEDAAASSQDRFSKLPSNEEEDAASSQDRLSKLPDTLLLNILQRVGTLDAVRACVLSNRLLKLPAMLSRIVIDVCYVSQETDEPTDLDFDDMVRANRAVADLTDKILSTRPPRLTTISELKLRFVLRHDHCLSIGRSVARAMATRELGAVQFKILTEKHGLDCTSADLLRFAKQFGDFFSACPDAFAGLTRLSLQNLRFGESDLPNLLGTCKMLEYLKLDECDAGIGSVLQIEHDRLVELKIMYGKYETIELCCLPKLQRMTFDFWYHDRNPLVFGFVPQLSKLSVINPATSKMTLRLSQLLANVSSISDLRLDFESEQIWVRPESPRLLAPVFGKLRTVNLDNLREGCDIMWTMFILEAAPSLEELCITVWDHWCEAEPYQAFSEKMDVQWKPCDSDFKHDNLVKLTIFGFQPDNNFMGYVKRVMEAAVRIKEVFLHDRKVCELCVEKGVELCPSRYPRTSEEKDSCIKKITEGLVMGSPAVIHLRS